MEQNYGSINEIFLQNVDTLFKTKRGKQIIKEYMSVIRGSKNLIKEHSVLNYIEKQVYSEITKDQINESINYLNDINKKQLKEDHLKLIKILDDNNIVKISEIENEKLYEDINKIIFLNKSIKSINEKVVLVNSITESIKNNKNVIVEKTDSEDIKLDDQAIAYIVKNFNEKYEGVFDEEQKKLFESITTLNEPDQIIAFEKNKSECLKLTNISLKEGIDAEFKAKLLSVKEKLLEDKFSKDTYVEDMLKYIILKETLED